MKRNGWIVGAVVVLGILAGCAGNVRTVPAPVEDRVVGKPRVSAPVTAPVAAASVALPGAENAGKPGYYTVKSGDTLIRIGLDHGQNWRDIVRWNTIDNPNNLEVGQVLRIVPPNAAVATEGVIVRPVQSPGQVAAAPVASGAEAAKATAPTPVAAVSTENGDDGLAFVWPVQGNVLQGFDEAKNKGVDLSGKAGDAVLAAADGRVVYAGSGLRGYGNLVILKHNNTFLTAYAHNQTLLVREDQSVKRGQKIAEMGNSDADQVKLHFEIRRLGKPVDPVKYLPAR